MPEPDHRLDHPLDAALGDEEVRITPRAATIVHDLASQIELAERGLGILSAPAARVSDLVGTGKLPRVLPGWFSPVEALYLYFPSRTHQSAASRAFVAFLKDRARPRTGRS